MGFEQLLGNRRIKENLLSGISRGRVSHGYLLSGPAGSGKRTLARLLAAAALCQAAEKPCLACPSCRKVMADTHPDVITVDDPTKKQVSVELVRDARADMFVQPNEGIRKIYLFPRAQDMLPPAQNALLKVLEEPPSYGVFLLLTDNPEKMLPTIRSRCIELRLQPLEQPILEKALLQQFPGADPETLQAAMARSGGYLGQAQTLMQEGAATDPKTQQFADAFAGRNALQLVQTLVAMEKWKREQLIPVLEQWLDLLHQALVCRNGLPAASPMAKHISKNRSSQELMLAIGHLQKAIEYAQGNVSCGAVCGFLQWALR